MNCTGARPLVHAYADGELDLVRSLEVEEHLKTCARCAAEKQSVLNLRSALESGGLSHRAPRALRQKVREMAGDAREKERATTPPWLWQWLTAAVAAMAVVAIFLHPGGTSNNDLVANELVSNHVRSLMVNHITDVVSSDQHTVKPWFNGKLDFAPDVKDFATEGFPLAGGRLDYLNGRTVAALVYRRGQHYINVFVWPAAGGAGKAISETISGYNIVNRDIGGLHYSLVSDLNTTELGQLADLLVK